MRKCSKCGARNDEQAIVCSLCNERLGGAYKAESYEPRLWNQGKQTTRSKVGTDPNATRDEPPPVVGKPPSGEHSLPGKGDGAVTTTRHYLVPPYGEPNLMDSTKSAIVFGRDEGCDYVLASTKVSRRHAEILFSKADKAYVRDLNSQNGTYVNDDKLVGERALEDGDQIRMGDFAVTYKKLAPGEDAGKLTFKANETAVMEAVKVGTSDDGALTGDIAFLPVVEVLRRLASLRAYGALNVDLNGMKGTIMIADGKPSTGNYAGLEGAPAIAAMSSLTKGHFSFMPDPNAPRPTNAPTPAPAAAAAPQTQTPRQPQPARPAPTPASAPKPAAAPAAGQPAAAPPPAKKPPGS